MHCGTIGLLPTRWQLGRHIIVPHAAYILFSISHFSAGRTGNTSARQHTERAVMHVAACVGVLAFVQIQCRRLVNFSSMWTHIVIAYARVPHAFVWKLGAVCWAVPVFPLHSAEIAQVEIVRNNAMCSATIHATSAFILTSLMENTHSYIATMCAMPALSLRAPRSIHEICRKIWLIALVGISRRLGSIELPRWPGVPLRYPYTLSGSTCSKWGRSMVSIRIYT